MRSILFIILLCLLTQSSTAQIIVNVENSRIQSDTTGWKGELGTSFSFQKNVRELLSINANAHVQYKTKKDLYLLLANYNLLKANGAELTSNMFYHFRYNRKLGNVVRWEAFTQWQQNKINNIELRALLGTGPRFKLHDSRRFKLFAGVLAMFEHETDTDPKVRHNDVRSDNYLSVTYKPNDNFSATSTTFYMPLYRRIDDYRILNQVNITLKATTRLSIVTSWDYSFDSQPPIGTPKANYVISNGFSYAF